MSKYTSKKLHIWSQIPQLGVRAKKKKKKAHTRSFARSYRHAPIKRESEILVTADPARADYPAANQDPRRNPSSGAHRHVQTILANQNTRLKSVAESRAARAHFGSQSYSRAKHVVTAEQQHQSNQARRRRRRRIEPVRLGGFIQPIFFLSYLRNALFQVISLFNRLMLSFGLTIIRQ